jgi:hypothetical protein
MALNIARLTLYKHGLGFFERAGEAQASFVLDFPRRAMDDVLKSLTVIPAGGAVIQSVAFETPPDRNPEAQKQPLVFDTQTPVSSMIAAFAGRRVMVLVGDRRVEGELIGLEREDEEHLERALLAVLSPTGVKLIPLAQVNQLSLLEDSAQADLSFAMEAQRRDLDRSQARITLSGPASLRVSYIAPAPAWRVSYRVLTEPIDGPNNGPSNGPNNGPAEGSEARNVLVQGWGLFDNTLEEDLENIDLTLTAGMPVSFRYALHEPNTPQRPYMQDEARTVSAPMEFAAMGGVAESAEAAYPLRMAPAGAPAPRSRKARSQISLADLDESAPAQASGEARGALFAYRISNPVSVRRGESGMVPILTVQAVGQRELLYSRRNNAEHPAASIRFVNTDATLERGPATVLDDGEYSGEAIVPFTTPGSEVILAFAVELGVTVSVHTQTREQTTKVRLRDSSLFIDVLQYFDTTYAIDSQLADSCVVTIEHDMQYNYTLETAALESTATQARFKVSVPVRTTTEFVVTERQVTSRYEDVRGIDGHHLQKYLSANLLEKSTFDALSVVLSRQAEIASLERETHENDAERHRLRERLEDVRANIGSLDTSLDSELRKRFIGQLSSIEDRLQALEVRDDECRAKIGELQQMNASALVQLSE